jgi:hypothetical protein
MCCERRKGGAFKWEELSIFRKPTNNSSSALPARHRVTHFLAKESKRFSGGKFVRKCWQRMVQEICPEKESRCDELKILLVTYLINSEAKQKDLKAVV